MPVLPITTVAAVKLTCTEDVTDYTVEDLSAGGMYRITAEGGRLHVGIADTTADAAKLLTVPAGTSALFVLPNNVTVLHYSTDSGAGIIGRLVKVTNVV